MVAETLLVVWAIGVVLLAFKLQTNVQEAADPEWQHAKTLYKAAPITFCIIQAITLALWPIVLIYVLFKFFAKGN